ncbi:tetratricopeptide repeat protein [Coleofasciculus sp. FACHB-129]|uniref:tetratricopeptide repeat protein n=1 Tax=Cyanophyceae TaxID=3028117 RepID=UPI001682A5E0|nr:tetratricopeptide repeat protein [Coleofasciculus sp. FACHB-129]MBD1893758.1 tetratricopeptide repeat protein [Coleofasciculus sp. FACHB-129]
MTNQIPYYISRKQAQDFLDKFAKALDQPDSQPLLFHVYGFGGVGKTTLTRKLKQAHQQQADFAEVSFDLTPNIRTPLELMVKLYNDLPKPPSLLHRDVSEIRRSDFVPDPFTSLYEKYQQTLSKLKTQPVKEKSVEENRLSTVRDWFELGGYTLLAIAASKLNPAAAAGVAFDGIVKAGGMLSNASEAIASGKERVQQLLQQHPATKNNQELQTLMLEPIPKLTQAFAEGLIQKAQKRPVVIILDIYEKAPSDIDTWLWQYLLEGTALISYPIRLIVAGRRSLLEKEGWRKLQQDRDLIYERRLDEFDKDQTKEYLQQIGITKPVDIQKIYKATKGLPYYLDWISREQEAGREIDFSRGNKKIVELLRQGLNGKQKQILQLAACCRWFDRSLIEQLMKRQGIDFETGADATLDCFDWLTQRDFVELVQGRYRLDDVARDVFRRSLWDEEKNKFRRTHELLASYFEQQANQEVSPDSSAPAKYENPDWREYTAESIYHALFANRDDGQYQLITHFFAGAYLNQMGVVMPPFVAVAAEADIEDYKLLPDDTRKFLNNINLAIGLGWQVLKHNPDNYEFKVEQIGDLKPQIEASLKHCLGKVDSLDGLAKYAGLMYQFVRCRPSQEADLLLRAKEQAEQIVTPTHPEFSSILFFNVSNGLYQIGRYEEVIASYDKALAIKDDFPEAWVNRGTALLNLGRYEEAIASYDKALAIKDDFLEAWYNRSNALANLGRYEEAIASYDKALEIKPDDPEAWNNRGNVLLDLGRYEEAIASYDKALEIKPDDPEAWNNRGNALVDLGRYEEAIASYDKALEIKPDDFNTLVNRSAALLNLSRYEEMIASCDKVLKIQPDNPDALSNQGLALSLLGRYNDALANHDKALKLQPNDSLLWANRGIVFARWGRYEKALASCDKALELQPNDESGYYGKACCYALQGDSYMAIENLQQAINLKPHRCRSEAKTNPDFDSIRSDSRFQALMQEGTN